MASKLERPLSFKAAVLEAFHRLGGVDSMVMWAAHNPTEFYKIASRLIPQEISGGDGAALQIVVVKMGDPLPTTPASATVVDLPALQAARA